MKKKLYTLKCIVLGILTSMSLIMELSVKKGIVTTRLNNDSFELFIVGALLIWFYYKFSDKKYNNKIIYYYGGLNMKDMKKENLKFSMLEDARGGEKSDKNIKLTTKDDLDLFKGYLAKGVDNGLK